MLGRRVNSLKNTAGRWSKREVVGMDSAGNKYFRESKAIDGADTFVPPQLHCVLRDSNQFCGPHGIWHIRFCQVDPLVGQIPNLRLGSPRSLSDPYLVRFFGPKKRLSGLYGIMGVQGGELSSNTGRRLGGTAEAVNPWKLFPPFSAKSLAFGRRCLQSHCWGVNMGSNKHGNPHCLSSWRMLCNNDASNATGEGIRSGTSERIRRWPLAESPPRTPQKEYWREAHGVAWCDLYQWLENAEDFEVMRHVNKENDYTDRVMKGTQRLQHALVREMMQRMPRSEVTPPEPWGEWAYWVAVPEGKEYPVYFRRRQRNVERKSTWSVWMNWIPNDACGDSAEIILDQNALADEFGYCHIGMCKISRDHTQMVYTLDGSGDERFTAYVKDLRTNRIHEEHVIVDVVSAEWAADGSCLFYTTCDHLQRAFRVYRRSLLPMGRTRTGGQDELLLEETDPAWFVDVSRTKDWRFITIYSSSKTSSKAYVVDASQPLASSMSLVRPAASGVRYFVEHHDDWLYILTNSPGHGIQSKDAGEQGTNKTLLQEFRLVKSKASQLGKDSSEEEVVPVPSELCIVDFDVFNGHCILYGRRNALPSIAVGSLHSDASATRDPITQSVDGTTEGNVQWQTVPLPEGVCSIVPGANQDFFATTLRFTVSSPNMPERTYDYDLTSGGLHLLQQNEVNLTDCVRSSPGSAALGNSKIELGAAAKEEDTPWSRYTCRQVLVSSSGKTGVPLTLVHQKSFEPKGQNPALIIGYGAYGEPVEVQWCSDRLSLLDRGWVIALAHVRGGGELGQTWHRAGMLERKPVSFADFVACAEWLPKHGYAHSEQLCGWGISAGGLLLGAAVNLRPELFRAVVMKVPFVDICNTMLNAELPLTAHEYDEWGNPKEPSVFHRLRSYSPYDNIRRLPYPAMLVTSSFNDSRVGYWEAMKWVAAVREHTSAKADVSPILLKVSLDAGHFGEGGRYSCLEETALEYAFLLQNVEHGMP